MKYNYCLVAIIIACLFVFYLGVQKHSTNLERSEDEAVIGRFMNGQQSESPADDGGGSNGTESSSDQKENMSAARDSSQEKTKILADGSKVNIMYDGFGNKTETRCFNNNPRLKCVTLTSAVNGQRQAVAYGQNGERVSVPENILGDLMNISGDEIANSAGIIATSRQMPQTVYAQATPPPSSTSFKPANNQSLIQNKPAEQVESIKEPELPEGNSEIEPPSGDMKNQRNEKGIASARQTPQ